MSSWDGRRGRHRHDGERDRRREDERRWFGPEEQDVWRGDRYGPPRDRERVEYGAGYAFDHDEYGRGAHGAARYGPGPYGEEPEFYGGQEYGLEGHSDHPPSDWGYAEGGHEGSRAGHDVQGPSYGVPGRSFRRFDPHQEFDPDYLEWREEQLRTHDRDYQEWRRHQEQQYDQDYRRFCAERRERFGRAFHEWRARRGTADAPPPSEDDAARPERS